MYQEKIIDEAIVSVSLGYSNGGSIQQESYMMFGGVNKTQFVGEMYDYPIVSDKWWALEFRAFHYDNELLKSYDPLSKNQHTSDMGNSSFAVVDTGNSMLNVPQGIFENLV